MQYFALLPYFLILAGVGLSYVGILPAMVGWLLSALGVLSGLCLAVHSVFSRRPGWMWPTVCAALPSMLAVPMVINDLRYPRINDVATNVEDPPAFVAALELAPNTEREMAFPEKNGSIIRGAYPNVRPLILDEPSERVFQRIEALAGIQAGWMITRCDAEARTLEGEARTSIFRFVDDFVIRVSTQDGKARIDMRSKSRDGLVDAGANAKRIEGFLEQLEKATATDL
ncbi:MAG: DUF1499 domain-containing protein [Verrucomicrobiota bacterium]